ncbi:hypothetical protein HPP92_025324 [Vanilla planifolia]|uniref:Serine-threonine/tyrosine-protein kinase catalytic domain-containing protein n=1 Tax=Vanilla planifolia TaxID=51239 RepID=A0A835PKE6_VANPL|nr:hypothetical protein HPP92_025324 [Vanilla planifolia]
MPFGMLPSSRRSSRSGAPSSRLRLWVVIAICVGTAIVLILFLLSLCLAYRRRRPFPRPHPETTQTSPRDASSSLRKSWRSWSAFSSPRHSPSPPAPPVAEVQVHLGKDDHRVVFTDHQRQALSSTASGESRSTSADVMLSPKVPGGAPRSRIWDGVTGIPLRSWRRPPVTSPMKTSLGNGYGIVYRGVLPDNTEVAIKNLLNNRGQAEKGVQGEVEAIGRVRHKNLVRLLGYCVEGAHRYVAPEYASTGMLNERSDVYSLRFLSWNHIREISDWITRGLLGELSRRRKSEEVVDHKMLENLPQSSQRALLVALRCVDLMHSNDQEWVMSSICLKWMN